MSQLAERLQDHLEHEEQAALPLVDATLSSDEWMQFGQTATERVGPNMAKFLPWLLDGADEDTTTRSPIHPGARTTGVSERVAARLRLQGLVGGGLKPDRHPARVGSKSISAREVPAGTARMPAWTT